MTMEEKNIFNVDFFLLVVTKARKRVFNSVSHLSSSLEWCQSVVRLLCKIDYTKKRESLVKEITKVHVY